ncbi:PhnD/SsuA/transferrin family substrate-binding protein [Thioclava sp. GXIMD4216]|uniref:sensor histidine kinase n=1 Tax=Thioclava sp. GXIMD4216 TaxID=3131929 RepID=UPI0030D441BB
MLTVHSALRGLLAALFLVVALPAAAQDIRVGVLAFQGAARARQDFAPTVARLAKALPQADVVLVPLDLGGLTKAVAAGQLDFVITNPGHYLTLEARFGVTRIATLQSFDRAYPTDTVGSAVIVRNRPGHATRLSDLASARLAVVSTEAFGGWQVAAQELRRAGVPSDRLAALVETGFPMDHVITALREGRADAAVLRACMLEDEIARGHIGRAEFAVVGARQSAGFPCQLSSRLYPDWPFARLAGSDERLAKTVATALLAMPETAGQAWTAPEDYTPVHTLLRALHIGPYASLDPPGVRQYLLAHWQWVLAASLALALWAIHGARVEILVRRRTAELRRESAEREKAERSAQKHLEERNQYARLGIVGEMASSIAHELNQPLAAIANYAEGLTRVLDRGQPDPAFLRHGTRGIAGQAERAGAILRRVRGFLHRRDAQRGPLDLNVVLREVVEFFTAATARHDIPLRLELAADLPAVLADRVEVEQVLLNLLQNALEATEAAPQATGPRDIVLATSVRGGKVVVTLRDHGTGLTEAAAAQLFDPFFTTKATGLGLGLPICRTIIESHGGRLWAETAAGGGVRMCFVLPASLASQEGRPCASATGSR